MRRAAEILCMFDLTMGVLTVPTMLGAMFGGAWLGLWEVEDAWPLIFVLPAASILCWRHLLPRLERRELRRWVREEWMPISEAMWEEEHKRPPTDVERRELERKAICFLAPYSS